MSSPQICMNFFIFIRLAYPVWVLNDLLDSISSDSSGVRVHILYDVACLLESHLKVSFLFQHF